MSVIRLKYAADINRHTLPESTDPGFEFKYIDIGSVNANARIHEPKDVTRFASAPSRARRLAAPGSTVVSTVRTYLRAVAMVPETEQQLVFSTGFAVIEPRSGTDGRYLAYCCQSNSFIDEVMARSTGVSYPAINPGDLGEIAIALPPLEEQRRIADFLDLETSRIGRAANSIRREIDLLARRAQAERDRMLDLGPVASMVPLQHLVDPYRPIVYGIVQAGPDDPDGVPYIKTGDLPSIDPMSLSKTSATIHRQYERARILPGDIVIAMRASIGTVAVVPPELPEANLTQGTARIATAPGIDTRWLFHALQTTRVQEQCVVRSVGTTFKTLNIWDLRRIPIPTISAECQYDAAVAVQGVIDVHQAVVDQRRRQLELLSSRYQALITAAVTGQIDVTTAGGVGVA